MSITLIFIRKTTKSTQSTIPFGSISVCSESEIMIIWCVSVLPRGAAPINRLKKCRFSLKSKGLASFALRNGFFEICLLKLRDILVEASRYTCWSFQIYLLKLQHLLFESHLDMLDEASRYSCWRIEKYLLQLRDMYFEGKRYGFETSRYTFWWFEI